MIPLYGRIEIALNFLLFELYNPCETYFIIYRQAHVPLFLLYGLTAIIILYLNYIIPKKKKLMK